MKALQLTKKYNTLLNRHKINTPLRLAHFFAQLDHESNLIPERENLNYTTLGLRKTFGKYFKTDSEAKLYAMKPEAIANKVYANRMGNGNQNSGDGWKYRGGGFMQHTGANEYKILTARTGVNFKDNPDLLLQEVNAMVAAIDYWNRLGLSNYADKDDLDAISDLINIGRLTTREGDSNGFEDRKKRLIKYKKEFKA